MTAAPDGGLPPMRLRRRLAAAALRTAGWRVEGEVARTGIFVGAPHTSNWDFVLAVLVLWSAGVPPRMLVKRELFWWPLGALLRSLGAVPTDRRGRTGLVDRLAAEAAASPSFLLVIAADGTRRRTDHWKSGFYRLAEGTGLPVTLAGVDGPRRTVTIGTPFEVTGDVSADMDRVRAFYADQVGVRPGRASTPRLREEDDAPARRVRGRAAT